MLTKEAIAFAELGKLVREFNDFADSQEQAVTDPEVLTYVNGIVRSMISGRNLSVVNITVDGDTFNGEARVKVSPRLTKRFGFEISPDSKSFEPLNADEIEKFAEPLEFKAGGKTLKCKIEQCGRRCLKGGEKCRLTMSEEERKAHDKALRKVGTVDTSLAKKRREVKETRAKEKQVKKPKKTDTPNYKIDRSDPDAVMRLGAEFSSKHLKLKEIPPSAQEKKLLEEKTALGKEMLLARESGDMKRLEKLAPKFFAKEDAYYKLQNKRLDQMDAQYEPLRQAIIEKHGLTREQAEKAIKRINFDDTLGDSKSKVEQDFTDFYLLTGGKGFKNLDEIHKTTRRAYADRTGRINVGYDVSRATNLHELGHHVEYELDKLGEASVKWRNSRATSTSVEQLNKLSPGGDYGEDEVALPGKFISPYVGKVYDSRTTEVVSMGLEKFANSRSMKRFREEDKEHFDYIVGVLLSED